MHSGPFRPVARLPCCTSIPAACLQICSAGESIGDADAIRVGGVSVAILQAPLAEHGDALRWQGIDEDLSSAKACAVSCNIVLLRLLRSRI